MMTGTENFCLVQISDHKKNVCEEVYVKEEACDHAPYSSVQNECVFLTMPDPATAEPSEHLSPDFSYKEDVPGEMTSKEIKKELCEDPLKLNNKKEIEDISIKEEFLGDQIHLYDEERLHCQEVNSIASGSAESALQKHPQEKITYPTSSCKERDLSQSNSEASLCDSRGKLKKKSQTLKKPYKCSSCPFQATRPFHLQQHIRKHTGEKPFKCSSCPYQAARLHCLRQHTRRHTGERPFKCSYCQYQASDVGNLKRHERIHSGEKPFKCSYCSFKGARMEIIQRHEATHTGEKPFKCNYCSYEAVQRSQIKRHMRTHTGEKPFQCSSCPYQAAQRCHLLKHMKTHSNEKPFRCSSCIYQTARRDHLRAHEKTHLATKALLTAKHDRSLAS